MLTSLMLSVSFTYPPILDRLNSQVEIIICSASMVIRELGKDLLEVDDILARNKCYELRIKEGTS